MKEITLKDAVKILRSKMEEDSALRKYYETIVNLLKLLFDNDSVDINL